MKRQHLKRTVFRPKSVWKCIFLGLITISSFGQNVPPSITSTGNQLYCPLTQIPIAQSITITDPDDSGIEAVYIQISTGYRRGSEQLEFTGTNPNIQSTWSNQEGKLALRALDGSDIPYSDLVNYIQQVVFESTDPDVSGERLFSISLGDANYLPETGHYYEYIPNLGITWADARVAAENRTYFGLQGYLATVTSAAEAQITGEQVSGFGWIGGSDSELEGQWKWVTGPETGTIFWNGGINGSSPNFAFWNNGEPNQAGDEDFVHITSPSVGIPGSWNDLSNTGSPTGVYQPRGYVVEYGGLPGDPMLNISTSTRISIPRLTQINPGSRCAAGTVVLTAEVETGADVAWYDSENSMTPIHIGSSFTTPTLNQTTTFYVQAYYNSCDLAPKEEVEATVYGLPVIQSPINFVNCDSDGIPDGFTDFDLSNADGLISQEQATFSYYFSQSDAEMAQFPISIFPYNNAIAATVYVRIENQQGCFRVAELNLSATTTSPVDGFQTTLRQCDDDGTIDGMTSFDLSLATPDILSQFPANQNLSVHYYRPQAIV